MSKSLEKDATKMPAADARKRTAELTETELCRVAGGFNPQPDPPARSGRH